MQARFSGSRMAIGAVVLGLLTCAGTSEACAAGLAGTWKVAVTLVDCSSGAALAPPFTSLLAFAGDGTESEATNNPALQPGQRSTAFGVWKHTGGAKYTLNSYALILFSTTGAHPIQAGSQTIGQTITVNGTTWTSTATIQFFDTTGTPVSGGCATAAASRLT